MEYYTVIEVATILGVTDAAIRQKIRSGELASTVIEGKISVTTQVFEDYLHKNRCWDFTIPEWSSYTSCRRAIQPQFVKIQGTLDILREYGIDIEQRTLKRWIHSGQIKAYNLGGTYYVPADILRRELS